MLASCDGQNKGKRPVADTIALTPCPRFNAGNAVTYIKEQCEFGPRVTGSEASRRCGDFLVERFKSFGAEVEEQTGTVTGKCRFVVLVLRNGLVDNLVGCAAGASVDWQYEEETE